MLNPRISIPKSYDTVGEWYDTQAARIARAMEETMLDHLEDSKLVGSLQRDYGLDDDAADQAAIDQVIKVLAAEYGFVALDESQAEILHLLEEHQE